MAKKVLKIDWKKLHWKRQVLIGYPQNKSQKWWPKHYLNSTGKWSRTYWKSIWNTERQFMWTLIAFISLACFLRRSSFLWKCWKKKQKNKDWINFHWPKTKVNLKNQTWNSALACITLNCSFLRSISPSRRSLSSLNLSSSSFTSWKTKLQ